MALKVKHSWWKEAFGKNIFPLSEHHKIFRNVTPAQVQCVIKRTGLQKKSKVLDLCCGTGRHSIVFAKKGMDVTGLDFSKPYLKLAKKNAGKLPIKWIRKDMRALSFDQEFDCVVNMWSSFGYFSPADNQRTAQRVYRSLKKGGYFFIDIIHADYLKKHYLKKQWSRLPNGVFQLEEGEFDSKKLQAKTQWYFIYPNGKVKSIRSQMDLYNKQKMTRLLKRAGFKAIKFYGGFAGEKLTVDSFRLIAIAKK